MFTRNFLYAQFGLVAILAGLHLLATEYFLYWRLPWFDILTHFVGGMWVALFAAWLLSMRQIVPRLRYSLVSALLFGIVWEIFEMSALIIDFPTDALDTVKDLTVVIIGGIAGGYLAKFIGAQ